MGLIIRNGINNCKLFQDTNAVDYQSFKSSLDFLENYKEFRSKTIIFQTSDLSKELYPKIARLFIAHKVDRIICIGESKQTIKKYFPNTFSFNSTDSLISCLKELNFNNEIILIKGNKTNYLEKFIDLLDEKNRKTVFEINLNSVIHNLNFFKSKIKPTTKVMVMVKASAYGHGSIEISKLLETQNIDYLGVAFSDEGMALRAAGISLPIMVLNPENYSFSRMIENNLEPEIYNFEGLYLFIKTAIEKNIIQFPIHIKLDTGMRRLGFEESDFEELISVLKENENRILIKSILSHLATSDDNSQKEFTRYQIKMFDKLSIKLMNKLERRTIRCLLNSSGISNFPKAQYDMVRLGIGLYGFLNDEKKQKQLQKVGSLKSIISQLRTIQTGQSVGYSRNFITTKTTKIATIPIGYADGISRAWGNGVGFVMINNKKAPIIGNICMDILMVDATGISCNEGDFVIIFGEKPSATEIAKKLKTIPYEILAKISPRVKKNYLINN